MSQSIVQRLTYGACLLGAIVSLWSANLAADTHARFSPAIPMSAVALSDGQVVRRVTFGSCLVPQRDQSIFNVVENARADAFLFLGDNVYAADESEDPQLQSLRDAYGLLAESQPFQRLRESTPLLVTWDDHDYGLNDAGADFEHKAEAEALYEYAWAVAENDPRSKRDGVYYERTVGPDGQRVQFVLLDTRFFRSGIERSKRQLANGYYDQHNGNNEMLGQAQWQWLEKVLSQPADVRIIATSVQMIATGHQWEAWHVMPDERDRFYKLLSDIKPNGVLLVSGDRHSAAIYRQTENVPYPLWEVTSSSLNLPLSAIRSDIEVEPGENRQGLPYYDANFGVIDIDWAKREVLLQIRDEKDRVVRASSVKFSSLSAD